ncbi:hypothetical protein [Acinetobacter schindleri]|uniref:hypothetical protein n=1 Tax=Acinetobacter schindleri TaxID=108981 RepID=UPI00161D8B10|nr:hypothetical protein [Acinetobacter schindleri]MBB4836881.1 hypothetical protein [Acinetobacter schindleri]WBX36812.1 hypothetical protein MYA84_08705 [Acinetobacter schindleri]
MSIQIVQPTPYDDAQFLWCTTWCEKNGLNPYDEDDWAAAKAEYLKTQGGQQ